MARWSVNFWINGTQMTRDEVKERIGQTRLYRFFREAFQSAILDGGGSYIFAVTPSIELEIMLER